MPKEVIYDPPKPGDSGPNAPNAVHVGWTRDLWVQIASINKQHEGTDQQGWYVDLSRDAINRLIRVLRKARDQAYGADE